MDSNQNQQILFVLKNKLCKEDKKLLEIPDFEDDIKYEIEQAKKKYSFIIIIGCILSKFGMAFCYKYSIQSFDSDLNEEVYRYITYFTIVLFTEVLIGFIVDLVSLKMSWIFTQAIFIGGIITYLASIFSSSNQYIVLANYLFYFAFACNYACGTYIIFDSSYSLKNKFIYQSFFITLGSFLPFSIILILNWFSEQLQIKDQYLILLILIVFSINLVGSFLVQKFYNKIVEIREKSQKYQLFIQYRGVGITLRSIINFYWNQNNIYLILLIICLMSLSSVDNMSFLIENLAIRNQNNAKYDIKKTLTLTYYLTNILGVYIIFKLTSKRNMIALSYKILKNLLLSLTVYQIILTFITQYQSDLHFYFLYAVIFVSLIFKGLANILASILSNTLIIVLQSENSSIRCIGLALFGALQDALDIIFIIDIQPFILNCILSLIGILDLIYCFYYLKNKSFSLLESQLINETNQLQNQNQPFIQTEQDF